MYDELTAKDIQKMEEEIEYRKLVVRKEALEDVKEARAHGDLSENFEYKAAKQYKNRNESRIRYLERMLKNAEIIENEWKDAALRAANDMKNPGDAWGRLKSTIEGLYKVSTDWKRDLKYVVGKSINDAPDIFKPGLRRMVERINSGDATVDPYMEFANTYPVRDSMRMMRLLYRLGIGSQERKQERLMMFSRTVSSLQNKARETKYKERLGYMESQTMIMLVVTGVGVMLIILIAMMMMFNM